MSDHPPASLEQRAKDLKVVAQSSHEGIYLTGPNRIELLADELPASSFEDESFLLASFGNCRCASDAKAIRQFCIECMGGRGSGQNYTRLIEECVSTNCPLYDFRFGKNPHHTQNLTAEQRKERGERLKSSVPRHKLSQKVSEFVFNPELHT